MALDVSLDGRVAVVTGASSGIGAQIAVTMGEAGADVVLVGRDERRLADVEQAVVRTGAQALALAVDLDDPAAVATVVQRTVATMGRIDALVHSAAIFLPSTLAAEGSVDGFERQWRTNVHVPYALTAAALPELRATSGSVIFVSSLAGRVGFPNATGYCATKGAIEMLTRSLAVEEAPHGVRVNAIAPGNVETGMNARDREDPEYVRAMVEGTPVARFGHVREIAPMVAFMASDLAGFMTGESVLIDGGWCAQ